ncbi:MAG: hypothetical protein IPL46_19345 [Saprospiraceae bacterium]|nr:hypothetical protein [Saprospiraceae bacterium]
MIVKSLYELFAQLSPLLRLMVIITIILAIVVAFLNIYLRILRGQLRQNEQNQLKFKSVYDELIIQYLLGESDPDTSNEEQKIIFNRLNGETTVKFKRVILVSTLIDLHRNITGDLLDKVRKLYDDLGLSHYALKKLKNWHWTTIIHGINELTEMQNREVSGEIDDFISHKRIEIQAAVQLYKANVFGFAGLTFLNDLKGKISEWQQIQLLESIRHSEGQMVPDITEWLHSNNSSVVSFALKLTEIYNLLDVKDSLILLLKHREIGIRIKATSVLAHLGIYECKDILKMCFDRREVIEQVAIVRTVTQFLDLDDLTFFKRLTTHGEFIIRKESIQALEKLERMVVARNRIPKKQAKPDQILQLE